MFEKKRKINKTKRWYHNINIKISDGSIKNRNKKSVCRSSKYANKMRWLHRFSHQTTSTHLTTSFI